MPKPFLSPDGIREGTPSASWVSHWSRRLQYCGNAELRAHDLPGGELPDQGELPWRHSWPFEMYRNADGCHVYPCP